MDLRKQLHEDQDRVQHLESVLKGKDRDLKSQLVNKIFEIISFFFLKKKTIWFFKMVCAFLRII